jgi:Ni/Co efflux regulator RcnB
MFNTKTLLAAASLAVLTAIAAPASAAPWEARHDRQEMRQELRHDRQELRHDRREMRQDLRHDRFERRSYINRIRIAEGLRLHRYRVIGDPYFVHGRYVVRTHDRFGRTVFVQVDPYSGVFMREVRL